MSSPEGPHHHVIIVGGGITGLTAAWSLQKEAQAKRINLSYTLLEQSDRWGGKILTEEIPSQGEEPFIVEGGPDSFITQKPWAYQLTHDLGIAERLLPTNDHLRKVFVLHNGRPIPLPEGVMLIVPTKLKPFVLSPLLSPWGKLRMGMDLLMPPKRDGEDETLSQFIRRRLGAEALDKIAEPLMSGIYNAEAERQSLLATFPRFRALEEKHGSLIKGMIAGRRARPSAPSANGLPKPNSMFISYQDGMGEIVQRLRSQLTGDCRLGAKVCAISSQPNVGFELSLNNGERIRGRSLILAVPAFEASRLVEALSPQAADELDKIRYVSTGTISLAFERSEIKHSLNGFGLVIPRSERRSINAITWTSAKFNRRAPAGKVMLRVFFGGSRRPDVIDLDDEQLVKLVRRELQSIFGINARPIFHRIFRWRRANPQYDVGHLVRVAAIEAALPEGLYVTGSPYRGIGIPDCVHQAQNTAKRIVDRAIVMGALWHSTHDRALREANCSH